MSKRSIFTIIIISLLTISFALIYWKQNLSSIALPPQASKNNIDKINSHQAPIPVPQKEITQMKEERPKQAIDNLKPNVKIKGLQQAKRLIQQRLSPQHKIDIKLLRETTFQATPVFEAIIAVEAPDKKKYSYQAFINQKTGKILQTWNQTRADGLFFKEHKQQTFSPTGTLKKE